MNFPVVTLTGLPGSGKTTAGRRVAQVLGLQFHSAGELFRQAAAKRHLDLDAFSRLAEQDESIDRSLDDQMVDLARPGRLLEGRITGALCRRNRIPVLRLALTARTEVRVERVSHRDGTDLAETRRLLMAREASERARYLRYYGIDLPGEASDLEVDSSELGVEAVVEQFIGFLRRDASRTPA